MRVCHLYFILSQAVLAAAGENRVEPISPEERPFVRAWNVADFDDVISVGLEGHRDYEKGRRLFAVASCLKCHQFHREGSAIGPDLSGVGDKFSPRDLLESILNPGKEITETHGQTIFEMKDGSVLTGRIVNDAGVTIRVITDMMHPDEVTSLDRGQIVIRKESPLSPMPTGLLNTLGKDDVLDLLAYLLSDGNQKAPLFAR